MGTIKKITLQETDKVIEEMCKLTESDKKLQGRLKNAKHWQLRWATLESFILSNLNNLELSLSEYNSLWVRERFFYKIQKRTEQDYGFCPYFLPAFRNRTKSILTGNLKIDMGNKCTYDNKTLETTCSGTDRDICVILHPKDGRT